MKVSREEYEALCKDLFDRVAQPVVDAMRSSEVTWEEVSELILMGGGTRTPLVQDILRETSGKYVNVTISLNVHSCLIELLNSIPYIPC